MALGWLAVVLLIVPVADVRRSYSGSSGSIVSKRGVEELIVAETGSTLSRSSASLYTETPIEAIHVAEIGIVVLRAVPLVHQCLYSALDLARS